VHTNRAPIDGRVVTVSIGWDFFSMAAAGLFREKMTHDGAFENRELQLLCAISGAIARRIVAWATWVDELKKGERSDDSLRLANELYLPLSALFSSE